MLIYAGIDEAGYGPMLGPLTVACTVFTVNEHDPAGGAPDLWKLLRKGVCRSRSDRRGRIAVNDSKKLKGTHDGPAHPLRHLERGVMAFLPNVASCPDCAALAAALGASIPEMDWYASRTPLPVAQTQQEVIIARSMLGRALSAAGVTCHGMACEVIDAGPFNRQVAVMGSKASVNFCAVLRHIDGIRRRWPSEHPRIVIDRQGGRTHYLRDLQASFPDAHIRVLDEGADLCRYELDDGGGRMTVTFCVEAERRHLPVALASMTAKYVRELLMIRLNRHFAALVPNLRPTAGYVQDGRRYVSEIDAAIRQLGVPRDELIRVV
jgi:hypothetical protein